MELGSNLNPDDIEEGDDVYFECKVHANPVAYKVIWKHNVSRHTKQLNNKFIKYIYTHSGVFAWKSFK